MFQEAVHELTAEGGGDIPEDSLDAIVEAVRYMNYRADARKMLVLITDVLAHYPGDGTTYATYTMEETVQACKDAEMEVYVISPDFRVVGDEPLKTTGQIHLSSKVFVAPLLQATKATCVYLPKLCLESGSIFMEPTSIRYWKISVLLLRKISDTDWLNTKRTTYR